MKILAKIPRLHKDRSHLEEMDFFDTDRNPLVFPSAVAAAEPIPYLQAYKTIPPDTSVPPWNPLDWSGVTLDWSSVEVEQGFGETLATSPDVETIRLERVGLYLVRTVVAYVFTGTPPSFDTMVDLSCNFGTGVLASSENRLGGQNHLLYVDHILGATPTVVFDFTAPVVVNEVPMDLHWWLHAIPTNWSGDAGVTPVGIPLDPSNTNNIMARTQIYRLGDTDPIFEGTGG